MARTFAWRSAAAAALVAAAIAACGEEVTAPGHCPELCPSDSLQVVDTVITGVVVFDTTVRGFTNLRFSPILVVADQDSLKARPIIRFQPLPQRWFPTADTAGVPIGTIDSIDVYLRLDARDTLAGNLRFLIYRLPALLDSTATFASTQAYFADSTYIDSIRVDSTTRVANLHLVLRDSSLTDKPLIAKLTPQAADSFVLSLGIGLRADSHTVAVLASGETAVFPSLKYYVHALADTFSTTFTVIPTFDTWVSSPDVAPVPAQTIVVGNQPSARAFMRFQVPSYYVDSTTILRATLQLVPTRAVRGFPNATFGLEALPVLRYFGGKSLLIGDTVVTGYGTATVGSSDTVSLEMGGILRLWRGVSADSLPRFVTLRTANESFEIGQIDFAGSAAGANAPRLLVSFVRPFKFGVP